MAITYHSGRRLQGLSTDENTVYDSSGKLTGTHTSDNTTVDGWLAANKDHIKVNGGNIKWDLARDGTNYAISYDLGANISNEKWLLRFRATWDTIAACAGNEQYIGVSDLNSTNSTTANHDFLGCMISMWASNDDFRNVFANGGTLNGGGGASNWSADPSRSINTFYFIEIKRLSTTTFSISFSSTDSYVGNLASSGAQTCSADTKNLRYIYFGAENAGSTECGQDCLIDNIQFYDEYTTPTTVGKPVNVQVGSRFEQTDTRKIYHYGGFATTSGFAQTWGKDPSSSQFEVSGGKINFLDNTSSTGDRTWLDLESIIGSAVSTTQWVLRFKFNFSTLTSGDYYYEFDTGLSDTTVNNITNQNFIGVRVLPNDQRNLWRPRTCNGSSNPRSGATANLTQSFSTGVDYYAEIKRTSSSNWSISLSTTDAYDGDLQNNSYTDASGATGLKYFKFGDAVTNSYSGFTMQGVCDVLEFYNGVTDPANMSNTWKEEGT